MVLLFILSLATCKKLPKSRARRSTSRGSVEVDFEIELVRERKASNRVQSLTLISHAIAIIHCFLTVGKPYAKALEAVEGKYKEWGLHLLSHKERNAEIFKRGLQVRKPLSISICRYGYIIVISVILCCVFENSYILIFFCHILQQH